MAPVSVEVFPAHLSAAAGSDADTVVAVTNAGDAPATVHLILVGEAAGWGSIIPDVVELHPGDRTEVTLRFRLPRAAPGGAGSVPFTVRAVPQEPGAYESVADGTIEIAGRSELAVRVNPMVAKGGLGASVKVAVDNLGQSAARAVIRVEADSALESTVEPDSVVVEPGGTEFARLHLKPEKRRMLRGSTSHAYRVVIEPLGGAAVSAQGTFEQRPAVVALLPRALVVLVVVGLVGVGVTWTVRNRGNDGATTREIEVATRATASTAPAESTTTVAVAPTTTLPGSGASTTVAAPTGPRRILFQTKRDGNPEIYVANPDGTAPVNVTNNPGRDSEPAWSPDGARIAFDSDRTGNFEVYVMNADGSNVEQLTHEPTQDGYPTWSPDGTQLSFVSLRDGNSEIYVMKADGTGPRRLTKNLNDDARPAWSPDGRQIAFHTNRDGNYDVYVMNTDGTNPTNITQQPSADQNPAWAPDGSQLSFDSTRSGDQDLYVMPATGGVALNVTENPAQDLFSTWSPDGTRLIFQSNRDADPELYMVDLHNKRVTRLTQSADLDAEPDWS